MEAEAEPLTTRQKLSRELKEYLSLSVYLYVCFGAIQLYKTALLADHGISYEPYGFAAAKALILGKFILLGRAASIGERHGHKPLILAVFYQSTIFLVLLIVLSAVEEAVAGAIHGRTLAQTIAEIAGGRWLEIAATCFLMWLILLPYFGFQQIAGVLGEGRLRRMLSDKR